VREGARVCVADIEYAQAQETAKAIGGGSPLPAPLDVTNRLIPSAACVAEVEEVAGGIDILVNNAAIFDMGPLEEIPEKSYDKVFAVNVKGVLFMMQAVAKSMIARGQGGKIINFASQAGRRGEPLVAVYCASKAAVSLAHPVGRPCPDQAQDQRQRHFPGRCRHPHVGPRGRPLREIREPSARRERSAWSAKASPMAAWACRKTMWAAPFSWPVPKVTMSSPRRSTSMAANG
jgi:hypothetical protein